MIQQEIDINSPYYTGILKPDYVSDFIITHIKDGDGFLGIWDRGANDFSGNYDPKNAEAKVDCRQFGYNANETRRSKAKGIGDEHVELGYKHRDDFMRLVGIDPTPYPHKRITFAVPWTKVQIQTVRDETGKYGRLKTITIKNGLNVNEQMRDIIGGVEFFDRKSYPSDYPIRPPDDPIYERYHEVRGVVQLKPEYQFDRAS